MDGLEFAEIFAYYQIEGLMPRAKLRRWAATMAALANGPLTKRDKGMWNASDFVDGDPWQRLLTPPPAAPKVSPAQRMRAMHNALRRGSR